MRLEELMKTMVSLICFLLLTALSISTYKAQWKPKTWVEVHSRTDSYFKLVGISNVDGSTEEYQAKYYFQEPPSPYLPWKYNMYNEYVLDVFEVTESPDKLNWCGLPKTRKKEKTFIERYVSKPELQKGSIYLVSEPVPKWLEERSREEPQRQEDLQSRTR